MMKSAQAITSIKLHHRRQRFATNSQTRASRLARRVGFTLVELLMVIAIIGILIGMLAVAINPVLQTARETTVITEMKQMELAIESFKSKRGFYPPSFEGITTAAQLLPYLNKLSPNHREQSPMFPSVANSQTRLQVWYNAIGRHLDDRGSLIFWLNGLSTNKQFPITGGLSQVDAGGNAVTTGGSAQLPVIFAADIAIRVDSSNTTVAVVSGGDDEFGIVGVPVERESLFDFRGGQLSRILAGVSAPAGIRVYNQPHGNQKNDLAYRYRNSAFYNLLDSDPTNPSVPVPNRSRDACYVSVVNSNGTPDQVFLNPNTFQLITLGLDGEVSAFATSAINKPSTGDADQRKDWLNNNDNITNFANGRLDGFDFNESVELGDLNLD